MQINGNAIKSVQLTIALLSSLFLSACGGFVDISDDDDDEVVVLPAQLPEDIDANGDLQVDDEVTDLEDDLLDDASADENLSGLDQEVVDNDEGLVEVDTDGLEDDETELTDDAVELEEELVQTTALPEEFTTVFAEAGAGIANTETVDVQSALGVQDPFVAQVFGFSTNQAGTILGVQQFTAGANSNTNVDHYAVDVNTLAIDALYQTGIDSSGALNEDFGELALSENCQAFTRRVGSGSAGTLVNQLTLANVCFTETSISANGDTAVFIASPAALGADGTTIAVEGFNSESGPIIVHRPTGTVTSLTLDNIAIPGTLTSVYNFSNATDVDISADGSTVVARLQFIPNVRNELALVEVLTLILVVDAASGETTAIDQQFIQQLVCASCQSSTAYNLEVSDEGERIIFLRPTDDELSELNAESSLFVHSQSSGETIELALDDNVAAGTLTISGSGELIAFVNTDGVPVLLNLSSGERVDMDSAIRGCTVNDGDDCELAGYQINSEAPLALNVDGSVLTLILVPDSTLPIPEAFLLDTGTLQLDRFAANRIVTSVTVDATGEHVAYSGIDNLVESTVDQNASEIFLIRR